MKKIDSFKKMKAILEENEKNDAENDNEDILELETDYENNSELETDDEDNSKKANKINTKKPVKKEEVFYLVQQVEKKITENETKRKLEIDKVNKVCEKEEAKDRKYIETLKAELLAKYQSEQDKCQKKLENIKNKALKRIEVQLKQEEQKIEIMCKNEVLLAINRFATKNSWFQTAIELYKIRPDFFEKTEK